MWVGFGGMQFWDGSKRQEVLSLSGAPSPFSALSPKRFEAKKAATEEKFSLESYDEPVVTIFSRVLYASICLRLPAPFRVPAPVFLVAVLAQGTNFHSVPTWPLTWH
jgi:hypothetical protein